MDKQCFKCGEVKPLSDFYKHPMMADGHLNKCKECNKKDVRENRKNNIEYYRRYDQKRSMHPKRVQGRKLYAASEQGKISHRKARQKWNEENLIKRAASTIVNNAVRDGKLKKPNQCEFCGSFNNVIHGHHDDYAKPLEVRWLCPTCHNQWHKENGEGANAQ